METRIAFLSHPAPELLEEYSFHRLGEAQADELEQHLLLCDDCRTTLTETEVYIRLMRSGIERRAPRVVRSKAKAWVLWQPAFAILAIGCVTATLFFARPRISGIQEPATVTLVSSRGGENTAAGSGMTQAPSNRPLDIAIDAADLPAGVEYRVEVVTAAGARAWEGTAKPEARKLHAAIPGVLKAGSYWVRLYAASSELLYEYGLRVE